MTAEKLVALLSTLPRTERLSALFVGHGSPMHGIEDSVYADAWGTLGARLPSPQAILVVSAHWVTDGTFVHTSARPRTIHDFWGFPDALYALTYPAPGAPNYATVVKEVGRGVPIEEDANWGLDHGAWIVLSRMYPKAQVPVFQVSIDGTRDGAFHYALGQLLAPLREHGVLLLGSGNIVHNLRAVNVHPDAPAYDWAERFDARVAKLITARKHHSLIAYDTLGDDAVRSIPTPEHYLPLLTILGASTPTDTVSFPVEGIDLGSISMRSVLYEDPKV